MSTTSTTFSYRARESALTNTILSSRLVSRSFTLGGRSSAPSGWCPGRRLAVAADSDHERHRSCRRPASRSGSCVFTRSTLTPFDNIGVMTMKMISSTSITSTIGVTLISATGGGAFAFSFAVSFVSIVDCCFHCFLSTGTRWNRAPRCWSAPGSTRRIPGDYMRRFTSAHQRRAATASGSSRSARNWSCPSPRRRLRSCR